MPILRSLILPKLQAQYALLYSIFIILNIYMLLDSNMRTGKFANRVFSARSHLMWTHWSLPHESRNYQFRSCSLLITTVLLSAKVTSIWILPPGISFAWCWTLYKWDQVVDILFYLASFAKILIVRLICVVACSHISLMSWLYIALCDFAVSYWLNLLSFFLF